MAKGCIYFDIEKWSPKKRRWVSALAKPFRSTMADAYDRYNEWVQANSPVRSTRLVEVKCLLQNDR